MDVDAAGLEAVHSVPYRMHRHCDEVEPSDRTSIGGTNIPNGGPIFLLSAFDATRSSERGLAGANILPETLLTSGALIGRTFSIEFAPSESPNQRPLLVRA